MNKIKDSIYGTNSKNIDVNALFREKYSQKRKTVLIPSDKRNKGLYFSGDFLEYIHRISGLDLKLEYDIFLNQSYEDTMELIINTVCNLTNIKRESVLAHHRKREFVQCRWLMCYFMDRQDVPAEKITKILGGHDRTTYYAWIECFNNFYRLENDFRVLADLVSKELNIQI